MSGKRGGVGFAGEAAMLGSDAGGFPMVRFSLCFAGVHQCAQSHIRMKVTKRMIQIPMTQAAMVMASFPKSQ